MKALTKTIAVFCISLLTTGFALAQAVETSAEPLPAPTPPSPPDVEPLEKVRSHLETLKNYNRSFMGKYTSRHSGSGQILIIPTTQMKVENLAAITQDLNIMLRLFEENLQSANIDTEGGSFFTSGRDVFTGFFMRDQQTIQSMYLQNYGALFLMKVDFPLSPPPEAQEQEQEEQTAEQEDVDPAWEQMKREIYEPEDTRRHRRQAESKEEKYDAEKVENLKTTLIKTLKHAANIRELKPEESVIISITGGGELASIKSIVTTTREGEGTIIKETASGDSSATVLVIRAKKSDIDAFAKGDLNVDQFSQKTQMLTYPLLGANTGDASSISLTVPTIRSRSSGRARR